MIEEEDRSAYAPLLSVAVTNYNYAVFLPCALDSILTQSFTDFELIVFDNASTDSSCEVLRQYADRDPRIRLVLHEQNQGLLASLREACDVARGTYLVYVDADDWVLTPTAFEEQIGLLEASPGVSFVFSPLTMIGSDGQKAHVSKPYQNDTVLPGERALEALLGFNINISGLMFRLEAYRRTGGWPSENLLVADQQLAARLAEVGDVGYLEREMYAFRLHSSNLHAKAELKFMCDEMLPMIEATFAGPLGQRVPDASTVQRRITRNALIHRPTQFIFQGQLFMGWRLYWESVRAKPILTIAQPRTLSLLSRTLLGERGHTWLMKAVHRTGPVERLTGVDHMRADTDPLLADVNRVAVPENHSPLVAFVNPAGLGSLGNAAIIDSLISAVRARMPQARIVGFTMHPADTKVHHDVQAAFEISSFSMPLYPVVPEQAPVEDPADHLPHGIGRHSTSSLLGRVRGKLRMLVRRHRLATSIFNVVLAAPRLVGEPRALRNLRETLDGTSTVVVSGGGQLNAEYGGIFGQPYVLWRFAHTARSVGTRFDVLSVGTGTLGWASRQLVLRALRSARYRSYRDVITKQLLGAPKFTTDDPIVPDLAYALPLPVPPLRDGSEVCVGISPMNYRHPDFHARGSQAAYENVLGVMERICIHLLRSGHHVVIFISDLSDASARDDLVSRLQRLPSDLRSRITVSKADTVASLWQTYSDLDAAVTIRLHAGLLGHVAHRPVLAIEHDRKVATMMAEMGHERFSFNPANLDEHEIIERLDDLILDRHRLSDEIADTVESYRFRVEEQYDAVFGKRRDG